MLADDEESFISVCLALEFFDVPTHFTTETAGLVLYDYCTHIIETDEDSVRKMRAHLFRVLVCWPRGGISQKVLNAKHFTDSFYDKPIYLESDSGNLSPQVHFFIAQRGARFHLCHWREVFDSREESEKQDVVTVKMHQRLQPFSGRYMVAADGGWTRGGRYKIEFSLKDFTELLPDNLTIGVMRGEQVYRNADVKFYLGFSLQGPIAYI
ncbi:hypothetical protein BaRGS_00003118 [Batillaria attramentaria]|uniref:Uncharacterized protein n=1 Tax=Batillaria attramentaria TaxID=370345 RepID=A0ABD0M2C2_9CAEN